MFERIGLALLVLTTVAVGVAVTGRLGVGLAALVAGGAVARVTAVRDAVTPTGSASSG